MSKVLLLQGNQAVVEGAIAAGVKFFAGYPITPSTEVAESLAEKLPKNGGKFIQMEDEIASMGAVIGASLTGKKVMTATSGPGFSLKQELIGYACAAEIPLVIVNVQRVGPSTGQPTSPSQGDVMQARWGTHGDHWLIALTPASVPECFELTLRAYALSEKYRVPVILLMDEVIGHMREKIELPDDYSDFPQAERKQPDCAPEDFKAYATDESLVPAMPAFGSGYRWHVTGLVHDETGFPKGTPAATLAAANRQRAKLENNLDDIVQVENYRMEDADFAVVAFGGAARTAYETVDMARAEGLKVGLVRPVTIWPFAEAQMKELAGRVKGILVHELNCGQYVHEVERAVNGKVPVSLYAKYDNEPATPAQLLEEVKKAMAAL
ncbi:2-oxoacid:acceptor oxidoreductase subunit alpha [Phascolarctobacterium sp. ET69]|jgi:2-oxoglutarate ferredoxin oxidoreductase subunit alpha|uniref:2-oxoacid:acceptor oxidoreductase subunit alpha n=1 Tax=Phascolarctobacterium sp. ET69 TaxID=2939420 RepID=UPI00033607A6|nr:2-oxoacid:acceptor oxidoreductase subunit alpha [Phascolarctobacterium sp. ET69]MCL1605191.1 2-oxoacid:acceptor oxidoreductase subunit alpha [Phascolarctobacterium sp. ET69]CDB34581.1 pyruvate flavodoxin/ferredoxin oxidoreductase thiamine diP-binding domain protein [Phascolarctobacterium sp. CAG:266]HJA45721.1 2-oxoacid:acceptor oxidoreductase subunit alpha [Candidatus Phascolarctobacterium stercoravium]